MPNLLASEPSAYLKSASHQPVHWHPWGEPAFARARRQGLTRSRCVLGDTRLAMAYLGLVFLIGIALTVRGLLRGTSLH